MTSIQYSDTLRPKIREDITFSPPERNGKGIIYYLKDQRTDWFYRIGAKDLFNQPDGWMSDIARHRG